MRSNSDFLIIVHVHEDEMQIGRLLHSVAANTSVSPCSLLVVNNATDPHIAKSISAACRRHSCVAMELNQFNWPRIRASIIQHVQDACPMTDMAWLGNLELGAPGWNVHHARNIGMVIAKWCFSQKEYILNFDSDITVPDDSELSFSPGFELSCLKISGCPDLSRFEWIALYELFLMRKYAISHAAFSGQYCQRLAKDLSTQMLGDVLRRFSSLQPVDAYPEHPDGAKFVTREEYHGACYLISTDVLERSAYASWFDNDWLYFQDIRDNKREVQFLDMHVCHRSAVKDVLNGQALLGEERGQILTIACEQIRSGGRQSLAAVEKAVLRRQGDIAEAQQLGGRILKEAVSPEERECLSGIREALELLADYSANFDAAQAVTDIDDHRSFVKAWQIGFPSLIHRPHPGIAFQEIQCLCRI